VDRYYDKSTGISKTEIITASASPLLVFVLFACAHDPYLTREEVDNIWDAYFHGFADFMHSCTILSM